MFSLEEIRSKPKEAKGRYALLGATIITLVIAAVWASTLPSRFLIAEPSLPSAEETGLQDFVEFFDTAAEEIGGAAARTGALQNMETFEGSDEAGGETFPEEPATGSGSTDAPAESPIVEEKDTPEPRMILIGTTTVKSSD